jgi:hypothetical protein
MKALTPLSSGSVQVVLDGTRATLTARTPVPRLGAHDSPNCSQHGCLAESYSFDYGFATGSQDIGFAADGTADLDNFQFGTVMPPTSGGPEPATWAMLIGGLELAGAGLRARRRRVAFG